MKNRQSPNIFTPKNIRIVPIFQHFSDFLSSNMADLALHFNTIYTTISLMPLLFPQSWTSPLSLNIGTITLSLVLSLRLALHRQRLSSGPLRLAANHSNLSTVL